MRPIEEDLIIYLEGVASFVAKQGGKYRSLHDYVLKEGQLFSTEDYTEQEEESLLEIFSSGRTPERKQCFYNAQALALEKSGLAYAEGFVAVESLPVALEHGWNYLPSGKVVDVTLRGMDEKNTCNPKKLLERARNNLKNAYFGKAFALDDIRESWLRNKRSEALLQDPVTMERILKIKRPRLSGLSDIPLPPNVERPEMWTPQAIVQAVQDGFTFMITFVFGESLFSQNAYWIGGVQFGASGLTVGPEHTPDISLIQPDDWIRVKVFFRPEMVPKRAWLSAPNEYGVVPVFAEIDPETIDWERLNHGHQIQGR